MFGRITNSVEMVLLAFTPVSIYCHQSLSIHSTSWYALGNLHAITPQVAVNPLLVVAVIVHSHGVTQVTNHDVLTVAIVVSSELHVTDWSHGVGVRVAVSCSVCPMVVRVIEFLSNVILSGNGIPIYRLVISVSVLFG